MLTATVTRKTCFVIEPILVRVGGINFDTSREDVIDAALAAARESRHSLFGTRVSPVRNDSVVVSLYRD
jgi:hypothetical protein